MKVKCSDCRHVEVEMMGKGANHRWCPKGKKHIPARKYDRPRKCGDFSPIKKDTTDEIKRGPELQFPTTYHLGKTRQDHG
jgi:hypothetical protein